MVNLQVFILIRLSLPCHPRFPWWACIKLHRRPFTLQTSSSSLRCHLILIPLLSNSLISFPRTLLITRWHTHQWGQSCRQLHILSSLRTQQMVNKQLKLWSHQWWRRYLIIPPSFYQYNLSRKFIPLQIWMCDISRNQQVLLCYHCPHGYLTLSSLRITHRIFCSLQHYRKLPR